MMITKNSQVEKKVTISKTYTVEKNAHGSVSMGIVWAETGKRLKLSSAVLSHLGNPTQVSFGKNAEGTGVYVQASECGFTVGKSSTVYAANLILDFIEDFNLDFTNHSSHTYSGQVGSDSETGVPFVEFVLQGAESPEEQ